MPRSLTRTSRVSVRHCPLCGEWATPGTYWVCCGRATMGCQDCEVTFELESGQVVEDCCAA